MITHQVTNSYGNFNYNAYVYMNIGWQAHFHGNYELIYAIDGNTEINVNGDLHKLAPGDFLLISPYLVHSLEVSGASRVWIGVFSEDYVAEFAKNHKGMRFAPFRCAEPIENYLRKYLIFQGTPEKYIAISCLNAVLSECERNADKEISDADARFVESVIEYISSKMNENVTMAEIADALGYEYHYFSLLFNRYFSIKFKNFLNLFKFQYACGLLADSSKSISEVCFESGFETVRSFNRVFRYFSGMTPTEYRKSL